jgi:hypothetical protein
MEEMKEIEEQDEHEEALQKEKYFTNLSKAEQDEFTEQQSALQEDKSNT